VTEAERYEKSVYKGPKKNEIKGRKLTPQEIWNAIISDACEKAPSNLKEHMQLLSSYDNVPRKEKPFRNFSANSLKLRGSSGEATITSIWQHLNNVRSEYQKLTNSSKIQDETKSKIAEEKSDAVDSMPTPEAKVSEEREVCHTEPAKKGLKKTVTKAMKKALKKAPNKALKIKELRKAIQAKMTELNENLDKDELKRVMREAIDASNGHLQWTDNKCKHVQLVNVDQ
jgi:cell growth-regulating nucleolar protein